MAHRDWCIWILARWIPLSAALPYIVCLVIHMQHARVAQMVGCVFGKPWDLGSIPRSPTLFNIFLSNIILCSTLPRAYHAASYLCLPRAQQDQSNGQNLQITMCVSQPCTLKRGKFKQAFVPWAQITLTTPPKGPDTPLLFVFFLLIFLSFPF